MSASFFILFMYLCNFNEWILLLSKSHFLAPVCTDAHTHTHTHAHTHTHTRTDTVPFRMRNNLFICDVTHSYTTWLMCVCQEVPCLHPSIVCHTHNTHLPRINESRMMSHMNESRMNDSRVKKSCHMNESPHQKLLGGGFSTPWHSFVLICTIFLDGYCSTVQGLLDWCELDWGFTELLFIQIGLCVLCVFDPLTLFCFDL